MTPVDLELPTTIHAPAKVNLFLHITGKRNDGFHYLDSGVIFTTFGDRITIDNAPIDEIHITGPFAKSLEKNLGENICIRCLNDFRRVGGKCSPVKLIIEKNIPVGGGLGGGSTNAAALLRWLYKHTPHSLSQKSLYDLAIKLGADVPVCLDSSPTRLRGIGECVSPLAIDGQEFILLANPKKQVSTKDVFSKVSSHSRTLKRKSPVSETTRSISDWVRNGNDLEEVASEIIPEIGTLKQILRDQTGAKEVGMSGSGATCFATFNSEIDCMTAAQIISSRDIWAVSTRILNL